VNLLILAASLPILFCPKGPETLPALKKAGATAIAVPPDLVSSWKANGKGIQVEALDPRTLIKLSKPSVNFRMGYASATREPWVDSNGWRILREPNGRFFYEAPGKASALAAAEAFSYGATGVVQTDQAGLEPFERMLAVLQAAGRSNLPPEFNFEYFDDGSKNSAEFMNLLVRSNLLFKVVARRDATGQSLQVALGTPDFPQSEAANPKLLAEKVRAKITDPKRLLRVYGSSVVIGRLMGDGARARLFLLNYGAGRGSVNGVRIRLLGEYRRHKEWQFDCPNAQLTDYVAQSGATEFTVADLPMFAVIDLSH
jgi:hypothetical protein